ncbi:methyl-accepting chemotaxis sensory transducer with GAF sensor [Calothrix sp. NIES-4071]|nr:methyl-accepting chemotaxis sensory transducer with GAF sensor [Calothrix sp. NIES-4071]BAZ61301.1 methyl-accepting chemotaxis sensory transducer with GAF sensor [Calothrix sp. NIES-4105]
MLDKITIEHKKESNYNQTNRNVDSTGVLNSHSKSFLDKIGLRTKALLFAITISTIPVLAVGAISYSFVNQSRYSEIETGQSSQGDVNKLLWKLGIATIITTLLSGGTATILCHRMILRIISANDALKKLGRGNLQTRIPLQGKDEITSLGVNINEMAEKLEGLLRHQKQETQQLRLFTNTLISIRQSTNTEALLNTTVAKLRQIFNADRVAIYQYGLQDDSQVLAESLVPGLLSISDTIITSQYVNLEPTEVLKNNQVLPINNIYESNFDAEQLLLLEQLQVKSKLTVPIYKENVFFGYLIIHYCSTYHVWQPQEVNFIQQLALQFGLSLERIRLFEDSQSLKKLAVHLSSSWKAKNIYNLAVQDIRQAIKADRVVIYKFDEKWQGVFLAESVVAGFPCAMGVEIIEPCLADYAHKYRQTGILAINNVYQAGLSNCYLQQLETFDVKANLVAPITVGDELLGLLIAHQCSHTRNWQQSEIDLFEQFARLVGLALERIHLLSVTEQARVSAEELFEEQRQQKELSQVQLMSLLEQINKIATVNNTRNEIKTVAKNARLAAQAVRCVNKAALSMNSIIDTSVENIATNISTIDKTVSKIKHLQDDSHSIASLAALINQIATQTNFVTINAGIEAARTSDTNQGFGIVAEEVAALANQCTTLALQIETIAHKIESETTEVITTVELQSQQVNEDTYSLITAKANLSEITDKCSQIETNVNSIYGATASQIQASKQVATALKKLSKLDTSEY